MNFQFTHPWYLLLLAPALAWIAWFAWKSDAQLATGRRWISNTLRVMVLLCLVGALAGLQWRRPIEGMNLFFVLDRSESVPSAQQDQARDYVNRVSRLKQDTDRAGVLVFGTEASIESMPNQAVDLQKIQAVVNTERTDLAAAIRLGTAAFPETGQKRLVLMSDGNENIGDALAAVLAARPLGVTIDAVPLGIARSSDVSVQKVQVPAQLKKGQTFEVKIFAQADQERAATVRLYRNDQFLGEQKVQLSAGKNLFTFPQSLNEPGFYSYDVRIDALGDTLPQNNRASGFAAIRGDPRVLMVSSEPDQDQTLAAALRSFRMETKLTDVSGLPPTLSELQSYDAIFLCNVSAGDLGRDRQKLLESAVRDFGVGLVCVGGDQAYAAGGYRGTPLENILPVNMELDSKKVLPSGAVVLIMHGMEFMNGNQVARDCAQGVLDALGPQDEMGVLLWDGTERWVFELQKVKDKRLLRQQIAGMNQGDLGSFQNILALGHGALKKSTANLKHVIIFSDGDPAPPNAALLSTMTGDRITVSTVLIAGHAGPENMIWIAENGKGRFYNVTSPADLPQIFIKETAVILKSAIYEEPFQPKLRAASEVVRGIAPAQYPQLLGYVATTPKSRAETPLWTEKGDPLLAHWQFGLGRAVAFTSDAKARWARQWLSWDRYAQFWSQIAQWSLRRIENAGLNADVTIDKGEGQLQVEAVDDTGEYRNFLNLQATVVSPAGERQNVRLQQTGPGRYEAKFPTKETGAYLLNLAEMKGGEVQASQVVGANVNYSPEFTVTEPNLSLLRRLAESGGGRMLDIKAFTDQSFAHDRRKTFQPVDLFTALLQWAIILFALDVGVRRVQIDREEWQSLTATLRKWITFGRSKPRTPEADQSLAALLARRDAVRSEQPRAEAAPELFQPSATPSPLVTGEREHQPEAPRVPAQAPAPDEPAAPPPGGTASRLLEAKRRAQQRRK